MAANKVVFAAKVLIDLTEDTVSADKLLAGVSAHDKSGVAIIGTVITQNYYTGTAEPDNSLGSDGDLFFVTG